MIFSLMVFAGCKQTHDIKENALSRETQSDPAESSKAASEQSTENVLNQLANQNFSIQGENLCDADDETIIEFGKAFVE